MTALKYKVILFNFVASLMLSCSNENPLTSQSVETKSIRHQTNIIADQVWNSDSLHVVATAISIEQAILKIKPGTKVKFEKAAALSVMDGAGLMADGTSQPITFSSDSSRKGFWKYIYFSDNALDDSCKLINCVIEFGGGDADRGSAVYCKNAKPTITNSRITHILSRGVILSGDCRGIELHDNMIDNCDFVPIQTDASNVSSIGNNTYIENGLNQIRIISGLVDVDDSWHHPSVPYRLADGLHIKNARLTIAPAVEFIFESEEGATISEGGSLQVVGTPSEPIIFTGSDIGLWHGISFTATADYSNSRLNHCVIENGGQDMSRPANIILENASPEISNCLIHQSIGYGVYISGKLKAGVFNNNIITKNSLAPISVSAAGVPSLSSGQYFGNGIDAIEVRGGDQEAVISQDIFWVNLGLPYYIKNIIRLRFGVLTLAPGLMIMMSDRSGFEIMEGGGLIADGSSGVIEIIGAKSLPGIWNQIYFSPHASARNCQLINCHIKYGGGDRQRPGMIYCDNISPIIRNCSIEFSQTWGIYMTGNAMISDLNSNSFYGNGSGEHFKMP